MRKQWNDLAKSQEVPWYYHVLFVYVTLEHRVNTTSYQLYLVIIQYETQTIDLYACAVSFCVRGARLFFFGDFEQLHKHTYMHQIPRLCKYPHKHSDLGLKKE